MPELKRRDFIKLAGLGVATAMIRNTYAADAARKPNIVFVLADDMGYGDAQCLNGESTIATPNFDKLAAEGMKFTDAHSGAAVCTPTRYGVVTGRYAWRSRLKRGVLGGFSKPLIKRDRMTVGSMLKAQGYHTACIGKWHLGMDFARQADKRSQVDYSAPISVNPTTYGFDYYFGVSASLDMPPYVYIENDHFTELPVKKQKRVNFPAFIRSGPRAPGFKPVETLDTLTEKATGHIGERAKSDKPFFLYLALTAPHKPVQPAPRFKGKSELGPYGDFIMQVDWTVGQVAKAIDDAGIAEDTLLIVTSDNGSYMFRLQDDASDDHVTKASVQGYRASSHRASYIYRGTKADIYEGGHRVPYIVRWPGEVPAGSVCDKTICLTDLMATCADVVGVELPEDAGEDSFSIMPLALGKKPAKPRPPVVHHSANGTFAVRDGKWKLIFSTGSGGRERPRGKPFGKPYRLFDMVSDPSETQDVADDNPRVVKRLTGWLDRIRSAGRSLP